jgi:hypothetical protein
MSVATPCSPEATSTVTADATETQHNNTATKKYEMPWRKPENRKPAIRKVWADLDIFKCTIWANFLP